MSSITLLLRNKKEIIEHFLISHRRELEGLALLLFSIIGIVSLAVSLSFTLLTLMDLSYMSIELKLLYACIAAYTAWIGIFIYIYLKRF